jgi:hypothetical protein
VLLGLKSTSVNSTNTQIAQRLISGVPMLKVRSKFWPTFSATSIAFYM